MTRLIAGPNGAGKTTTMRMIIAEENPTQGKIRIGKHNIESNTSPGFDQLGYCPQVTNYPLFRKIKVISIWGFVFQQYGKCHIEHRTFSSGNLINTLNI